MVSSSFPTPFPSSSTSFPEEDILQCDEKTKEENFSCEETKKRKKRAKRTERVKIFPQKIFALEVGLGQEELQGIKFKFPNETTRSLI